MSAEREPVTVLVVHGGDVPYRSWMRLNGLAPSGRRQRRRVTQRRCVACGVAVGSIPQRHTRVGDGQSGTCRRCGLRDQQSLERRVTTKSVFIAASIPKSDYPRPADAFEVTAAVVAVATTFIGAGYRIVTAAHPTIAPIVLQVAAQSVLSSAEPIIRLYQSRLFDNHLPEATRALMDDGHAAPVWTDVVGDADPENRSTWRPSLDAMRVTMFRREAVVAGFFIGGMEGITDEFDLLQAHRPTAQRVVFRAPGGEAGSLPAGDLLTTDEETSPLYRHTARIALSRVRGESRRS